MIQVKAQLSIGPGGWITVKEGGSMMIGTDLHIKSVPDSSGYFVDQTISGDVTITGDILVERYLTPDIWHNVASPVSNETSSCYTGTDLVFWYNESLIWNDWNFGWVWYYGATGGPLMIFRGYDVLFYDTPVTVNYLATGPETLNTGSYTYNITNSDPAPYPEEIPSHKGWNLAGNPYPSPVDWLAASGWDKSDINDAKYIWDGENDIYTIFIGGSAPFGLNGGTRFIPSNQGFWVQAVQTGSISINNSTRLGDMTGTPDFYKLEAPGYPFISLLATGNDRQDEIAIRFIEGTSVGFDLNYDATKLYSFIDEVPQLSIQAGKQVLALNTLPEITNNLVIPLNFSCGKEGLYHIRLSGRSMLDPSVYVFLVDILSREVTELSSDSVYSFYHNPAYPLNRFELCFNFSGHSDEDFFPDHDFTVFSNGNGITIIKNTLRRMQGIIYIYNLMGQVVHTNTLNDDQTRYITLDVTTGYYIIHIITNQQVNNFKILVINNI